MQFSEKTVLLKDGRQATVRSVLPSDAEEMLAFLKDTAGETDYLLRYPEECTEDVPGETRFLETICQSPNSAMLVCVVDGVLAGNVALQGNTRQKIRHRGSLALAVRKDYWGLGIATMLMETAISLAADSGMAYLELDYMDRNQRAGNLYRRLGFQELARIPDAYRLRGGKSADTVMMRKIL